MIGVTTVAPDGTPRLVQRTQYGYTCKIVYEDERDEGEPAEDGMFRALWVEAAGPNHMKLAVELFTRLHEKDTMAPIEHTGEVAAGLFLDRDDVEKLNLTLDSFLRKRYEERPCPICHGTPAPTRCKTCNGHGTVYAKPRKMEIEVEEP